MGLFFVLFLLAVALFLVWLALQSRKTAVPGVPGPMPLLQLPTIMVLGALKVPVIRYLDYLHRSYGPVWSLDLPGFAKTVTTLNAADVQCVLSGQFENFARLDLDTPVGRSWRFQAFFGRGIFAANGPAWSQQRGAARAYFTIKSLEAYVPIFDTQSKVMLDILDERARDGGSLDLQDLFFRYTLDSFGQMGFGFEFNSLREPPAFPALFDYLQLRVEQTLRNPVVRSAADPEFSRQLEELNRTIYSMIETRKAEQYEDKPDLLSRFMCLKDEDGKPYDDEWLRDILFNFLIAGRDTTAITLTWFFYLVSTHAEVEQRLLAELAEHCPDGTVHNQKQLKPLRYLDWCLSETLRLYPAVPTEGRLCIKETRLPSGYTIPANTFTSVSSYLMHRRADYFPDPLAFKPERWEQHPPHAFAYIPFYGGPQVCLGQSLALLEAKTAIVNILARYRIRLDLAAVVQPVKQIVLRAKHGLLVRVHPADADADPLPMEQATYLDV